MAQPRYVLKNVNLLNIILFIILVYVVKTIALPFFNYQDTGILPAAKKQVATAADAKAKPAESKGPSPLIMSLLLTRTLFILNGRSRSPRWWGLRLPRFPSLNLSSSERW